MWGVARSCSITVVVNDLCRYRGQDSHLLLPLSAKTAAYWDLLGQASWLTIYRDWVLLATSHLNTDIVNELLLLDK